MIDRRQFLAGSAAFAAAGVMSGQQTEGPPGPSGPISIKGDRPTLLMGDEAVITGGPKPQTVGHGAKRLQVGNWTSAEDSFTWQVDAPSSGEFLVTALTRARAPCWN
jgi:TAT (twin-arginine translocation) pathway signal sequence